MMDPAILSRLQFAFTVSFHILFPAMSIGLVTFLAIMEGLWLKTKNSKYLQICKFWSKIFALTFGMGVVSGIVMEFQFGTNWAGFSALVGPVLGALFTYEVLTAFFIEAGFLGVMLFGWGRVSPRMHFFATLLVALGTNLSAFWILAANSWMQTPDGFMLQNGHFIVTSWQHVILNPSVIPRFIHMLLAAYITAGFVVAGISAHYLLQNRHHDLAKTGLKFSIFALLILMPLQIWLGDEVGLRVLKYQPMKTAAMEGVWDTQAGAPLLLFALPDQKAQRNFYEIGVPHGAALINTHQWNGVLQGLKTVPLANQPPVAPVFFSFRIMVGLGLIMLLFAVVGAFKYWRKNLFDSRWFLHCARWLIPSGFLALWCGWITAEEGRQPWAVYNILRTDQVASQVNFNHVLAIFVLLIIVYGVIFGFFYFHYLLKTIRKGPDEMGPADQPFMYMPVTAPEDKK